MTFRVRLIILVALVVAATLGVAESLESLYAAEAPFGRDFRVIPLFHVPELYAVSPQVKTRGVPGVLPSGQWRFEDVWLEAPKP